MHVALSRGMSFVTLGFHKAQLMVRAYVKSTEKGEAANPNQKILARKLCAAIPWNVAGSKLLAVRRNAQSTE